MEQRKGAVGEWLSKLIKTMIAAGTVMFLYSQVEYNDRTLSYENDMIRITVEFKFETKTDGLIEKIDL